MSKNALKATAAALAIAGALLSSPAASYADELTNGDVINALVPGGQIARVKAALKKDQIVVVQRELAPEQVISRLSETRQPEYFRGAVGFSVVLNGEINRIGNGAVVTNGQVLTMTAEGSTLTTVTSDSAVWISRSGEASVMELLSL
jgi:hypothetical protein